MYLVRISYLVEYCTVTCTLTFVTVSHMYVNNARDRTYNVVGRDKVSCRKIPTSIKLYEYMYPKRRG